MKKLTLIFAMAALCGTFMVSCEKNLPSEQDKKVELKSIPTVDPSNSKNEFDYFGEIHNNQLMHFVDSMKIARFTGSADYAYDRYYVQGLPSKSDLLNCILESNIDPENYSGLMSTLYNSNKKIFNHYLVVREIVNDTTTLQEKVNAIKSYENNVDYSEFNKDEIMALKATFSVARYTMVFWSSSDQGGLDYYKGGLGLKVNYIGGSPRTHAIAMADIGGTLTGALFTWNPITAIGGGLASSAWQWMFS